MTRFHRSGHWRTNQSGTRSWVSGHTVDRDAWSHPGGGNLLGGLALGTDLFGAQSRKLSSRSDGTVPSFTVPNARCPECGALVFFYQNVAGSRVFFDDLGPPWPKHPCTDMPAQPQAPRKASTAGDEAIGKSASPGLLDRDLFSILLEPDERPAETDYGQPLTKDGWERCVVKKKTIRNNFRTDTSRLFYVVRSSAAPEDKPVRFSTPLLIPHPYVGDTVYLKDDMLSFFDFETFEPRNVEIERKRIKIGRTAQRRSKKRQAKRKNR